MKTVKKIFLYLPKKHKIMLSTISFILLLLILIPSEKATASRQTVQPLFQKQLEIGKRYPLKIAIDNIQKDSRSQTTNFESKINWKTATIRSGDSLAKIFQRLGYKARTTYEVSSAKGKGSTLLKSIKVGDTLRLGSNSQGQLLNLQYPFSQTKTLHVKYIDNHYESNITTQGIDIRVAYAQGKITSNFWNAAITAGLNDPQIINLANVFGWDIDFALDLRKGDTFNVIYEKRYIDGKYIGQGHILAAEFVNHGEAYHAIRFKDGHYYTPKGKSMRKAFLRAPVNFKYISSGFQHRRFHPVQKRWKAHQGIDYAAKIGTPVIAAGDGRVMRATYNRFNGNYVFINHGRGIVTKYLHFSKRAVKKGQYVKQGQLIGYVGMTGLATGPHLHYGFEVNGVYKNPRTVKLPDAKPIAKKYRIAFKQLAAKREKELLGSKQTLLAMQ